MSSFFLPFSFKYVVRFVDPSIPFSIPLELFSPLPLNVFPSRRLVYFLFVGYNFLLVFGDIEMLFIRHGFSSVNSDFCFSNMVIRSGILHGFRQSIVLSV